MKSNQGQFESPVGGLIAAKYGFSEPKADFLPAPLNEKVPRAGQLAHDNSQRSRDGAKETGQRPILTGQSPIRRGRADRCFGSKSFNFATYARAPAKRAAHASRSSSEILAKRTSGTSNG